ncbi:MAG TPA: YfhO family protein [Thermoanaerobaculia bacterium]|nr:YfhO family protein [Thermoanaerobaculia bacterium]
MKGSLSPSRSIGLEASRWRWLVLAATVAFQGWLLLPELARPVTPLNDDAFHIATALHVREVLQRRPASALDPWFSYWSLGYPLLHAYQPLAPLVTGALGCFAPEARFIALYQALKLLLLLAFPLCVYLGARWLELDDAAALGAALVAPLVATDGLFGLDYGSYLWRGTGLYTQLWASCLLPLAIGRSWAALRGRAGALAAAALLALTFLGHAIYGYIAVLSLALAAGLLLRSVGPRTVLRRAAPVLGLAGAMVAFFVVPMLLDAAAINRSRWEPTWKWDSFGARQVLERLGGGELFDHGRLPVLTALLAAGLVLALRRGAARGERFVGFGFLAWLALYFGRPTWGASLYALGITADVPLHRLIGGVHLFGILLAGLALGRGAARLAERRRGAWRWAVLAAALLLLAPAAGERIRYVHQGLVWLRASEAALTAAAPDVAALHRRLAELQEAQPGRIYPGLAARWGGRFKIGEVRVFDLLSLWRLDAVAYLFHAMSLPSDVMVEFDEDRPAAYDALDVRYVVMDSRRTPPPFLQPLASCGRFQVYGGPSSGRIGLGALGFVFAGRRDEVYGIASAWLESGLPAARVYGEIDLRPGERRGLPVLRRWDLLPEASRLAAAPPGEVRDVRRDGDDWTAEVDPGAPAVVVLKETFHPSWRAEVDGKPTPTLQVTPGFVAVAVGGGRHHIAFRYRPSRLKLGLFLLGVAAPLLCLAAPRAWRRPPDPAGKRPDPRRAATKNRAAPAPRERDRNGE